MDWEARDCPLCGSNISAAKPEVVSEYPAELKSFDEVKSLFVGFRKTQTFFTYYRCSVCDLLYCPFYFNQEQLNSLYREMPDNLMGEDKSVASRTQSGYAKFSRKYLKDIDSYVEIGPDIGLVAREIDKIYQLKEALLVEPNTAVRAQLLSNMQNCNLVNVVDYLDYKNSFRFDLLMAIHVVDHLLVPRRDISEWLNSAKNKAHVVVVVHNEKSLLRRIMRKSWPPFCLQHPQLFNRNTLKKALHAEGWEIKKVSKTLNWYSAQNLLSLVSQLFGFKSRILKTYPKIEVPIKVGNLIFIFSKKEKSLFNS